MADALLYGKLQPARDRITNKPVPLIKDDEHKDENYEMERKCYRTAKMLVDPSMTRYTFQRSCFREELFMLFGENLKTPPVVLVDEDGEIEGGDLVSNVSVTLRSGRIDDWKGASLVDGASFRVCTATFDIVSDCMDFDHLMSVLCIPHYRQDDMAIVMPQHCPIAEFDPEPHMSNMDLYSLRLLNWFLTMMEVVSMIHDKGFTGISFDMLSMENSYQDEYEIVISGAQILSGKGLRKTRESAVGMLEADIHRDCAAITEAFKAKFIDPYDVGGVCEVVTTLFDGVDEYIGSSRRVHTGTMLALLEYSVNYLLKTINPNFNKLYHDLKKPPLSAVYERVTSNLRSFQTQKMFALIDMCVYDQHLQSGPIEQGEQVMSTEDLMKEAFRKTFGYSYDRMHNNNALETKADDYPFIMKVRKGGSPLYHT